MHCQLQQRELLGRSRRNLRGLQAWSMGFGRISHNRFMWLMGRGECQSLESELGNQ